MKTVKMTRMLELLGASIVAALLALPAASVQAGFNGGFDRPDLMDVYGSSSFTDGTRYDGTYARGYLYVQRYGGVGYLRLRNCDGVFNCAGLRAALFEPDTLRRTNRTALLRQSRFVEVEVYAGYIYTSYGYPYFSQTTNESSAVENCLGLALARDLDRVPRGEPAGDPDQIRMLVRCPRDLLDQLGFDSGQISRIQDLLGSRPSVNVTFSGGGNGLR